MKFNRFTKLSTIILFGLPVGRSILPFAILRTTMVMAGSREGRELVGPEGGLRKETPYLENSAMAFMCGSTSIYALYVNAVGHALG